MEGRDKHYASQTMKFHIFTIQHSQLVANSITKLNNILIHVIQQCNLVIFAYSY